MKKQEEICIVLRHPRLIEGQTALARGFLKVLKMIYGKIQVIDTTTLHSPNKYMFYAHELILSLNARCKTLHLLNVNKPLIAALGLFKYKELITYQFSYLPTIHSQWEIKKLLIERGSKLVIGTSRRIAELFNNGFFTYPPIDTDLFMPRDKTWVREILNLPRDKFIVGYVGDVDIKRGFDIVVKLASELRRSDVKFLITSLRIDSDTFHGGTLSDVIKRIREGIRRNSLMIINKPLPIWYIYNAVDVLLLPIRGDYSTEPPVTLLEAISSGTPVIGGPSPSMQDYRGLYIMANEYEDYLDIVASLDANELAELSARGREFALRSLSYARVAEKLRKTLNRVGER